MTAESASEAAAPTSPLAAWKKEVPRALFYPLNLRALVLIAFVSMLWSVFELGPFGFLRFLSLPFVWIFVAYSYVIILQAMRRSAEGDSTFPPVFFGNDLVDDLVHPLLRLMVVALACYLPLLVAVAFVCPFNDLAILLLAFLTWPTGIDMDWWITGLKIVGAIYFPMALLAVIVRQDLRAMIPSQVVRAISRCLIPYAAVVVGFLAVNALHDELLHDMDWAGILGGRHGYFTIEGTYPFSWFAVKVFLLYSYFVLARLLGLIHWTHRRALGWFENV